MIKMVFAPSPESDRASQTKPKLLSAPLAEAHLLFNCIYVELSFGMKKQWILHISLINLCNVSLLCGAASLSKTESNTFSH